MRNMTKSMLVALFTLGLLWACSDETNQVAGELDLMKSEATPVPSVSPIQIPDGSGGNVECGDVEDATGCSFENSSERFDEGAQFSGTVGPITWSTSEDLKVVTWSSTVPVKLAVIVKGGPGANVYVYGCGEGEECSTGDTGLISPLNQGGNTPELSNIAFCWTVCEEKCYDFDGETAWAAGTRYITRGNWATYTTYAEGTVDIFAGQTIPVGTATFSAVVDGKVTITIELTGDWVLEDVVEAVKIQGYDVKPPAVNPAPGLFTTYKGNELTVTVPAFNFYGIHLNVGKWVEVPCEE